MIFSIAYYWETFAGFYLNVYAVTVLIFSMLYVFFKQKKRNELINWLYVFNTIVPVVTLVNLFLYSAELFIAWYGQNSYEYYVFKQGNSWNFWLMGCCNFLLPQLLWFKKLRKNIVFSVIMAVFLSAGLWFERLVLYITSTYRDYLPSSWSTYHSNKGLFADILIQATCFTVTSSIVYWFLNKRKKLPFSSAILSYSLIFISYSLLRCFQNFS